MAEAIRVRELATACGRRFGVATLASPETLNALTLAMVDVLQTQLTRWAIDPDVVGVLLDGEGDKDRKPRWKPARLEDVDDALVADHFRQRYPGENPLENLR